MSNRLTVAWLHTVNATSPLRVVNKSSEQPTLSFRMLATDPTSIDILFERAGKNLALMLSLWKLKLSSFFPKVSIFIDWIVRHHKNEKVSMKLCKDKSGGPLNSVADPNSVVRKAETVDFSQKLRVIRVYQRLEHICRAGIDQWLFVIEQPLQDWGGTHAWHKVCASSLRAQSSVSAWLHWMRASWILLKWLIDFSEITRFSPKAIGVAYCTLWWAHIWAERLERCATSTLERFLNFF